MKQYIKQSWIFLLFMVASATGFGQVLPPPDPVDGRCYYPDNDEDGYGDANAQEFCVLDGDPIPFGYIADNRDCNDNNKKVNIPKNWYLDSDGDGHGDPATELFVTCEPPANYVLEGDDCNDNDPNLFEATITYYKDGDGDGYGSKRAEDILLSCEPTPPSGYVSNNYDHDDSNDFIIDIPIPTNCSEASKILLYRDRDRDGMGNSLAQFSCSVNIDGYSTTTGDCDDEDPEVQEIFWYVDSDGDGFGHPTTTMNKCDPNVMVSLVDNNSDCDDGNPAITPNTIWYADADGDTLGDPKSTLVQCRQPSGYVRNNTDRCPSILSATNACEITTCESAIYINIGSDQNIVYEGNSYLGDDGFGYSNSRSYRNTNGDENSMFQTERYGTNLKYVVPVPDGVYTIVTYHNELWFVERPQAPSAQAERRVFDIYLEGEKVKESIDFYTINGNNPLRLAFGNIEVTDGTLDVNLKSSVNNGSISGLAIIPISAENPPYKTIATSQQNYVYARSYQKPVQDILEIDVLLPEDVIEEITYYDGLGRPMQQIAIGQSPDHKDILMHLEYDNIGRQNKDYLPFINAAGDNGTYRDATILGQSPKTATQQYYQNTYNDDFSGITDVNDINAYSQQVFEPSPLNRTIEVGAPGKDWKINGNNNNSHTIKTDWLTNTEGEVVTFKVGFENDDTGKPILVQNGYYANNELYVTLTKDENWTAGDLHTTKEYKNKQGQVLLKRTYNTVIIKATPKIPEQQKIVAHDTYYVYDDFGNLTYVIPPKVDTSDGVSAIELSELCYQYKYDYRNRLFEKKIPGKGFESIIYNLRDEPIATQDANLREKKQWLFTRYDDFGRVAYTGIVNNTLDRETLQKVANDRAQYATLLKGLDDIVAMGGDLVFEQTPTPANPNSRIEILTINYYDNYDFTTVTPPTSGSEELFKQQLKENVTSYPTGSKVRVLDTNTWINTINYYDYKGRPIYNYSKNEYLSTIDITVSELDFTGRIMQAKTTHTKNTKEPIVTIDRFEYDHVGRLVSQTQELNNSGHKERITENRYDALGVLTNKKVGGAAQGTLGLQDVAYKYNVRGWLTGINDRTEQKNSLFGFTIGYNNPTSGTALFNGNISETIWSAAGGTRQNRYTYNYDALNRITSATSNENNYNLNEVSYDKVGNILGINRSGYDNGFGVIDDLVYKYDTGNKLLSVTDNAPEEFRDGGFKDQENLNGDYKYDANGNMIADGNKRINEIVYNHLNLPISIISGARHESIEYKYDATGVKIEKCLTKKDVKIFTKYAGNFVYQKNTNPGAPNAPDQLQFFNHPEGYIEQENDGSFSYIYQYKDHLGNIRLSYSDADQDGKIDIAVMYADLDGDGDFSHEIREVKNYYPFGLLHKSANGNVVNGRKHNYGFNGVEENYIGGDLLHLEMPLRQYDPAIARWTSIDPVTHHSMSTYNSFDNNPVYFADPSGADSIYNFDTGQYVIDGQVVSQQEAIDYANNGGNADGSNNNTPDDTIYKNASTEETVEVKDGIDKTIEVSDTDFQTAKLFSMVVDNKDSNPNDLVDIYNEFYQSVNSYDGASLANLIDYLFNQPDNTLPKEEQIAVVNPLAADLLSGGTTRTAKTSGWIARSVWRKLDKSTKAKFINAIGRGIVAPTGKQGIIKLTATEAKATGFTHKLKILGKGGDLRIYGTMGENGHVVFRKLTGH